MSDTPAIIVVDDDPDIRETLHTYFELNDFAVDEAADGEILLSPRAAIALEDDFEVASRGEAQLKGLREPLEIFCLSDPSET